MTVDAGDIDSQVGRCTGSPGVQTGGLLRSGYPGPDVTTLVKIVVAAEAAGVSTGGLFLLHIRTSKLVITPFIFNINSLISMLILSRSILSLLIRSGRSSTGISRLSESVDTYATRFMNLSGVRPRPSMHVQTSYKVL